MKTLVLCSLLAICSYAYGVQQKYSIKGVLMCGEQPQVGSLVKLVDEGMEDTLLGSVTSNSDGWFLVEGSTEGGSTGINPTVTIDHNCGGGINPGARRWRMKLPKSYIVNADAVPNWFYLGVLNLVVKIEHIEDHDRDCN